MSCIVKRNNEGGIVKVLDPVTGLESELFNKISKLPHVDSLEKAVEMYDQVLKVNPSVSSLEDMTSSNYKKWKGSNKEVSSSKIGDVKTGEPIVASVYHGTTHSFDKFDADVKGSIEGHLGKVNYFTSDIEDASQNYQADGADITGRVENLKERIVSELENREYETFDEIYDYVSENFPDFDVSSLDGTTDFNEVANRVSENQLLGSEEQVLELYVKLNNPVVLGNNTTWVDVISEDLYKDSLEDAAKEIAEENDITVEEAKEDYSWDITNRAIELENVENPFIEALQDSLNSNGYSDTNALNILDELLYETEVNLTDLEQKIRNEGDLYDNHEGELAGSQVIADFFENLGYDGIILNDVSTRFPGMGVSASTSHVHVFNKNNNQIKLSDGGNVTFDETTENIFFSIEDSKSVYDSYDEALKKSKDKYIEIVSNGEVIAKIPTTKDENTTEGLINAFILDGILASEQVVYNGESYYTVPTDVSSDANAVMEFLKQNIYGSAQNTKITITKGTLIKIEKVDSSEKNLDVDQEISSLIIDNLLSASPKPSTKKISESNLRQNLFKLLNDMGISISSMKSYKKKYKLKNGKEVSVNALVDISNRVVAFKGVEGEGGEIGANSIKLEDLTEEVMHFIVETLPQEQLEELSDFIKASPEYTQHYPIYNELYKGDQQLLEKEILGKIMQNIALGKTEGYTKSLWNKIVDIIESFFDGLNIKTKQFNDLKSINRIVEDFVIQQTKTLTSDDIRRDSKGTLFSIEDSTTVATESMTGFLSSLKGKKQFTTLSEDLKNLDLKDKNDEEYMEVVNKLLQSVEMLTGNLEGAYAQAKSKEEELNFEGVQIKDYLKNLRPQLNDVRKDLIDVDRNTKNIEDNIKEAGDKIDILVSKSEELSSDSLQKSHEKRIKNFNPEEQSLARKHLKDASDGKINDINFLFSFFGQLHHSSNTYLKLLGAQINDIERRGLELEAEIASRVTDIMEENDFTGKDFAEIHNEDGFVISDYDRKAIIEDKIKEELEAYNAMVSTKKTEKGVQHSKINTVEEYKNAKKEDSLFIHEYSISNRSEYEVDLSRRMKSFQESIMSDLYYKNFDKELGKLGNEVIYEKLGVSAQTLKFLSNHQSSRASIKNSARLEDGRVILSPKDVMDIENLSRQRRLAKSVVSNTTGTFRKGIDVSFKPEKGFIEVQNGVFIKLNTEGLSEIEKNAATLAYDLNNIDGYHKENTVFTENSTIEQKKEALYDILDAVDSSADKVNTLISNTNVSLSQEYYDSLPENQIFTEEFEKANTNENGVLNPIVKEIKKLQLKRSSILNSHRSTSSPIEINKMYESDMREIASLSNQISELQEDVIYPKKEQNENEGIEKQTNNSYRRMIRDNGIKEGTEQELQYLVSDIHSSVTKDRLKRIAKIFDKKKKGMLLSESEQRLLAKYEKDSLFETQLFYAKQNLQPYYTRQVPENYTTLSELRESGVNLKTLKKALNSMFENKMLDVKIDNSLLEDSSLIKYKTYVQLTGSTLTKEDFEKKDSEKSLPIMSDAVKEEYKKNLFTNGYMMNIDYDMKEGGMQPKKNSKYFTGEATKFFGLDSEGKATKNKALHELRNVVLNTKKEAYKNQDSSYMDIYSPVQISQTKTEQANNIVRGTKGFKEKSKVFWETLKSSVAYRVDDLAYGEKNFKKTKLLPKYYTHTLEDTNEVSSDHFMALMMLVNKSSSYKSKKEGLPEMEAISSQIYKSTHNDRGKELKNVLEMTRSYIDSYIYGEQERVSQKIKMPGSDFEVDLSKVARAFTNYLRLKNLGFKLTTAVTGGTTGYVMRQVETYLVKEKLNPEAARLGYKDYKKMHRETALNGVTYKDFDKTETYGFMQWMGEFSISEKARNSKYGPISKFVTNSAMSMYSVADYPVTLPMALGMMRDNKMIDGKVYNRQRYYQTREREGIDKKVYEAEWTNNNNFINDHIDFKNGVINVKDSFYDNFSTMRQKIDGKSVKKKYKDLSKQEKKKVKEEAESALNAVRSTIKGHLSLIKGQIPSELRTTAQRHVAGSMMMMHKGYASVLAQNFFKDKGLNYETGQLEEGKYRTLFRLLGTTVGGVYQKDTQQIKDFFKKPKKEDFEGTRKEKIEKYNEALLDYELKIRNTKRLSIEMGSFLALGLIFSAAFAGFDDDELDDVWAAQATNYILHRTLNESSTNLSFGLVNDIKDTIKSPFSIHMQGIDILKGYQVFNGDVIASNKYKGMSQRQKYLIKNTVMANAIYDLSSAKTIKQVTDSYDFYSKEGLNWTSLGLHHLLNNKKDGWFR